MSEASAVASIRASNAAANAATRAATSSGNYSSQGGDLTISEIRVMHLKE